MILAVVLSVSIMIGYQVFFAPPPPPVDANTPVASGAPSAPSTPRSSPATVAANMSSTNIILKSFDRTVILQTSVRRARQALRGDTCSPRTQSTAERAAWAIAIQDALDAASSHQADKAAVRNRAMTTVERSEIAADRLARTLTPPERKLTESQKKKKKKIKSGTGSPTGRARTGSL